MTRPRPSPVLRAPGMRSGGVEFGIRPNTSRPASLDHRDVDHVPAVRVGAEHDAIAEQVDAPRHPARNLVDALQRLAVERDRPRHAGDREAVANVVLGLLGRERLQVKARDDALRELLEVGPLEHRAQLGLADQDDLQELALVGLEVRQQAQLLEHLGRELLRLVDDQDVVLADCVRLQQEVVEGVDIGLDRRLAAPRRAGCGTRRRST